MLHVLAKECIEMFSGLSELFHVDHILYSAMELDLHQVIKHSCYFNDDEPVWFVAHLRDLLYHNDQLELMELGAEHCRCLSDELTTVQEFNDKKHNHCFPFARGCSHDNSHKSFRYQWICQFYCITCPGCSA